MSSPDLSARLLVGATGLVRFNATSGTCYPVTGVQAFGRPTEPDGLHFGIDLAALTASAARPARPNSLLTLAPLAVAVARANWCLLALAAVLALAACVRQQDAPPAPVVAVAAPSSSR